MKPSPLAPAAFAPLPDVAGVRLHVAQTGIRYKGRPDLLLMKFAEGTLAAGVFTTSKVVAAPVTWCRALLQKQDAHARGLVVNAGNANAFTGTLGMEAVTDLADTAAKSLGCRREEVFMASTGVIGEPLKVEVLAQHIEAAKEKWVEAPWHEAAQAIMTTDTFMKVATRKVKIGKTEVTLNGIAKGSGMIAPNMATLLAFVCTDAKLPDYILRPLVAGAADASFNCITVDGDTSTNDTLMLFATGKAPHTTILSEDDPALDAFRAALYDLMRDLAIQVVKDGEGAQKLVTITVHGAESDKAARTVALTIANSPLVKTAIAGQDANWGRIVGAAGRAGEKLEQEKIEVSIGGVLVARNGARVPDFDETPVAHHMRTRDIHIDLNLHLGRGQATVYTCDLTHGYIDINGSYRS